MPRQSRYVRRRYGLEDKFEKLTRPLLEWQKEPFKLFLVDEAKDVRRTCCTSHRTSQLGACRGTTTRHHFDMMDERTGDGLLRKPVRSSSKKEPT